MNKSKIIAATVALLLVIVLGTCPVFADDMEITADADTVSAPDCAESAEAEEESDPELAPSIDENVSEEVLSPSDTEITETDYICADEEEQDADIDEEDCMPTYETDGPEPKEVYEISEDYPDDPDYAEAAERIGKAIEAREEEIDISDLEIPEADCDILDDCLCEYGVITDEILSMTYVSDNDFIWLVEFEYESEESEKGCDAIVVSDGEPPRKETTAENSPSPESAISTYTDDAECTESEELVVTETDAKPVTDTATPEPVTDTATPEPAADAQERKPEKEAPSPVPAENLLLVLAVAAKAMKGGAA